MEAQSRVKVTITIGPYAMKALTGDYGTREFTDGIGGLGVEAALGFASGAGTALDALRQERGISEKLPDLAVNFEPVEEEVTGLQDPDDSSEADRELGDFDPTAFNGGGVEL